MTSAKLTLAILGSDRERKQAKDAACRGQEPSWLEWVPGHGSLEQVSGLRQFNMAPASPHFEIPFYGPTRLNTPGMLILATLERAHFHSK